MVDDFSFGGSGRVLHVRNAPSPAATASLAIGRVLADLAEKTVRPLSEPGRPAEWPRGAAGALHGLGQVVVFRFAGDQAFHEAEHPPLQVFDLHLLREDVVQRVAQQVIALASHREGLGESSRPRITSRGLRTCSTSAIRPSGRRTRTASAIAARSLGIVHSENEKSTVSKCSSG